MTASELPNSTPQDAPGLTALAAAAAALHEMFLAYQQAGFTEKQSLYLVGQVVAARRDHG